MRGIKKKIKTPEESARKKIIKEEQTHYAKIPRTHCVCMVMSLIDCIKATIKKYHKLFVWYMKVHPGVNIVSCPQKFVQIMMNLKLSKKEKRI